MSKVICISNQKGGCGKSTVSFNLAAGLARKGKSVLCIDNDPQGNLTMSMGHHKPDELSYTLADVVDKITEDKPFDQSQDILKHDEGVDLMPANIGLQAFEGRPDFLPKSRPLIPYPQNACIKLSEDRKRIKKNNWHPFAYRDII